MIKWSVENNCVGCPQGCISCGRKHQTVLEALICDSCGKERYSLYDVNGSQLCEDCILSEFKEIDEDNFSDFI